jgi:hypothetical protein
MKNSQIKIENFYKNPIYSNSKRKVSIVDSIKKPTLKIGKTSQSPSIHNQVKSNSNLLNFEYIEIDTHFIKEEDSSLTKEKKTKTVLNPTIAKFLQLPNKSLDREAKKKEVSPIKLNLVSKFGESTNLFNGKIDKSENIKKTRNAKNQKHKIIKKVDNISSKFLKLDALFKPNLFN